MAIFEWRKFNFFDLKINPDDGKLNGAAKEAEIHCGVSGKGQIILCDSFGNVHIFYRNWERGVTFKGHDSAIFLCALSQQNNLLITLAIEDGSEVPVFKVWNLNKISKNGEATCLRAVKTALQKPTTLAVSENGQFLAIGFERGGISLYRGDISRDRTKTVKTLSNAISEINAITGLSFKQQGKATFLFVCSDSGVLVYSLQNKDRDVKIVLDKTYAATRCCALQLTQGVNETHFMVGRDDAVYCYTIDGRGPCYALEGQKCIIEWFRSHLLAITKSNKNILSQQKEYLLTVIDIENKFIVYTAPIDEVAAILIEFGTCFIVTKAKTVLHLDEKDVQSKLNLLFKKNLYDIAIRIAKSQQYDAEGLAEIFKQYGDHLYGKGNFSGAVEQYIKTIGYLEPSYIIRRFLDSRHIHCLTDYLQALHKLSQATTDHTTLLLNCFTRLDQTDKLKEFLSNDNNPDIIFDLDVAIRVCRNASVEQALSLAIRNQKHDHAISILLEQMQNYEEALKYMFTLPFTETEEILKKYGSILMEHCPYETAELLKRLCTNYNASEIITFESESVGVARLDPKNFMQLFIKHSDKLIEFLDYLVVTVSPCNQIVYNTLMELYLQRWKTDKSIEEKLLDLLKTYDDVCDKNQILILCKMYKFWPGIMWIYEEEKLYHLIVRHHLKNRDYNSLLMCCKRLSASQPFLWLQVLTGLRNDDQAPTHILLQVLNVIAMEKLQSPLQVLNCLAVDNGPNLSCVREYFMQVFQKDTESAKEEEQSVDKLRLELLSLKDHIFTIRTTVEFRNTICDTCNQGLSIPAIYFLCKHAFHQDCIRSYSDNDKECVVCQSRNIQLFEGLRAQSESRNQHETFHDTLDRSHEPFSVVAEYFGHGLFNKILIVDEQDNLEINQNIIHPTKKLEEGIDSIRHGAGAEAKLRLVEGTSKFPQKVISKIQAEGRLRSEEAFKYSTSVDKTSHIIDLPRKLDIISQVSPGNSPKFYDTKPKTTLSNVIVHNKEGTNPFEEDTDDGGYDKSKNPFEQDSPKNQRKNINEYDNNRNPFE